MMGGLTRGLSSQPWIHGDAKKEAIRDGVPPIELVDGEKLVSMLEELEIGLVRSKRFGSTNILLSFGKVSGRPMIPARRRAILA